MQDQADAGLTAISRAVSLSETKYLRLSVPRQLSNCSSWKTKILQKNNFEKLQRIDEAATRMPISM